jgi:hypothetical protein
MRSSGGEVAAELAALLDTAMTAVTAWAAADPHELSDPALGGRLAAFGALAAQVGVAALAAADPQQLADAALGEGIVALGTIGGQLEAQRLRWLAVFDGRGAGAGDRGGSTAGWLGWHTRQGPRHSARIVRLARSLHRQLPATHAALAAGDISVGHADVLAQGTDDLPEDIVAAGEPTLVEAARRLTPHQLRAAVLHWRAHVAPEQVDRDFAAHHERRRLHVSSTLTGSSPSTGCSTPKPVTPCSPRSARWPAPAAGTTRVPARNAAPTRWSTWPATPSTAPSCPTPAGNARTSTSRSICRCY